MVDQFFLFLSFFFGWNKIYVVALLEKDKNNNKQTKKHDVTTKKRTAQELMEREREGQTSKIKRGLSVENARLAKRA